MGQPMIIIAAAGLTGVLAVAFADFNSDLVDASRARTAADAAALAGVSGGRAAAERMAAANGATIVAWADTGRQVTVTVQVGDATVVARATDDELP